MTGNSIVARALQRSPTCCASSYGPLCRPSTRICTRSRLQAGDYAGQHHRITTGHALPGMLAGPLNWGQFPERDLQRNWGQTTIPYAAFAAACLVDSEDTRLSMGDLRTFLVEQPLLIWLLGFPLAHASQQSYGFDVQASLPTARHFTRLLRTMPNSALQFLLADSVRLILAELTAHALPFATMYLAGYQAHHRLGQGEQPQNGCVEDRFDKDKQPKGDRDSRLGCERRHHPRVATPPDRPTTPTTNPLPAAQVKVGEFYWGYGSGVVVVKASELGEFVLAELTQPFDQADVSYFFPLMAQAEQRLGYRPRHATFDAAFDAWYVYAHFHRANDPNTFCRRALQCERRLQSRSAPLRRPGAARCSPPAWPCRSSSPSPTAPPAASSTNAASTSVRYVSRPQPQTGVP